MRETQLTAKTKFGSTDVSIHVSTFAQAKAGSRIAQTTICSVIAKKLSDEIGDEVPSLRWGCPISQNGILLHEYGSTTSHFDPTKIMREYRSKRISRLRQKYPGLAAHFSRCPECQEESCLYADN